MEKDQQAAEVAAAAEESGSAEEVNTPVEETSQVSQEISHEELSLMLEDARGKADDHWDQLVRVKAELENSRKRQTRELENAHKFALERFVNELLPVRDSMELGLNAAREEGAGVDKLVEGTELTLKLFSDVMERFEVVQINPKGESFDPEFHQAISMQPRDDVPPNTVVVVVQKGYTLNDRLVRPAMVIVSQINK